MEDMTVESPEKFSFQVFGPYKGQGKARNVEKQLGGIRSTLEHKLVENEERDQLPHVKVTVSRACKYNEIDEIK